MAIAAAPPAHTTTVVTVDAIDAATERAVWYARAVGDTFHPVHAPGRKTDPGINARWLKWIDGEPRLERLSADEGRVDAVLEYVWRLPRGDSEFVNVVVPELFKRRSLFEALRRTSAFAIKLRLLREPGVVITDVPLVEGETPTADRLVARILVSGVHGASLRAVNYARTLRLDDVRAVFFAFDSNEARRIRDEWQRQEIDLPLEIVEAPFRDLGDPLRAYLRELTGDGSTVVTVIMPELDRLGLAPAAAQPARALRQAAAPVRAARDPLQRPVPAPLTGRGQAGAGEHEQAGRLLPERLTYSPGVRQFTENGGRHVRSSDLVPLGRRRDLRGRLHRDERQRPVQGLTPARPSGRRRSSCGTGAKNAARAESGCSSVSRPLMLSRI